MADEKKMTREEFLTQCGRGLLLLALGGGVGGLAARNVKASGNMVWQIDPAKCIACGRCATHCVLEQSAVRCVNAFSMCGYCDLCSGFFGSQPSELNEGAENQICPTNAIVRRYVEEPYFEYTIDKGKCIACGRCVSDCAQYGNGSLHLQISQEKCVDCNQCSIATACPRHAISRVPADTPYIPRQRPQS
ncbi:MAG: 4Fe-4S binding protein [Candidatus Sumerlaeia bacterium]